MEGISNPAATDTEAPPPPYASVALGATAAPGMNSISSRPIELFMNHPVNVVSNYKYDLKDDVSRVCVYMWAIVHVKSEGPWIKQKW